jgi:hypothetical protein
VAVQQIQGQSEVTTTNKGRHVIRAIEALQEFGRMTAQEFADWADISRYDAHAVLIRMNKRTKAGEKRIHIAAWIYEHDGARRYPRPVFAVGDRRDKPRPKADPAANKRRYDAKRNKMHRMNSVFNMAMPRDRVRERAKVITQSQLAA